MDITKAVLKLTDNQTVKKSAEQLEEAAYSANRLLTPESLKTIEAREIRATFIKVALQHIYSIKAADEGKSMKSKVTILENRAIGGGLL